MDLDGSLYNAKTGILNINSQRLSYIIKLLKEKGKNEIEKHEFIAVLKRLNNQVHLIAEIEKIDSDTIDIKELISSQIDWDTIFENTKHLEKFLSQVFVNIDTNHQGNISKHDQHISLASKNILFNNKSFLSFEEFIEKVKDVVNDNDDDRNKRVHGGQFNLYE